MSEFKVGEVCEFHSLHSRCLEFNGTECVITGGLEERYGFNSRRYEISYLVRCASDHNLRAVQPQYLRRKEIPYDGNEVGAWDLCPWSPNKSVVSS